MRSLEEGAGSRDLQIESGKVGSYEDRVDLVAGLHAVFQIAIAILRKTNI